MRRARVTALGAAALVAALGVWWLTRAARGPGGTLAADRITVEVLNGTGRSHLARIVTRHLREQGIDVVYFGNAPGEVDSTRIIVRRGDEARGEAVQRALRAGRVVVERDSLRLLDVTVLLGADLPTPLDFHP